MPHYEFFCHACKHVFPKTLSPAEYEEGDVVCLVYRIVVETVLRCGTTIRTTNEPEIRDSGTARYCR
jgi:hypothetical protein